MNSEKSYDSLPNFTAADCELFFFSSTLLKWLDCLWLPNFPSSCLIFFLVDCLFLLLNGY